MITATRIIEFDAGHRLLRHESKCAHIHGHRYKAEVYCVAPELDKVGRVVDFGVIKALVGKWVDDNWDHAFIVNQEDTDMVQFLVDHGQRYFQLWSEPSAENLASFLLKQANALLAETPVSVHKIKLWETPNCFVEVLG